MVTRVRTLSGFGDGYLTSSLTNITKGNTATTATPKTGFGSKTGTVIDMISSGVGAIADAFNKIGVPIITSKNQNSYNKALADLALADMDLANARTQYDIDKAQIKKSGITAALESAGLAIRSGETGGYQPTTLGVVAVGGLIIGGVMLAKRKQRK